MVPVRVIVLLLDVGGVEPQIPATPDEAPWQAPPRRRLITVKGGEDALIYG